MSDFSDFILLLAGLFLAVVIFIGVTSTIKKSLHQAPPENPINMISLEKQQKYRMQDIRRRQKELMMQHKQRLRDSRR